MNDKRVIEVLEELVKWTKIANFDTVKSSIEKTLNNEKKKKAYMLTGTKTQSEIRKMLKMSPNDISELWQECARRGLVVKKKKGKGYERVFDLDDFGLLPKNFKIEEEEEKEEEHEKSSLRSFGVKENEETEAGTENN